MFERRPYQQEGIEAIFAAFAEGTQRPAVLASTGAGKTVMAVEAIKRFREENPGRRVAFVAHRDELIKQTVGKITSIIPNASVGVVKAARDETDADIVVCSAQTLAGKGRVERLRDVGLVVVDECHHYAARKWLGVLRRLGVFDAEGPRAVGFTATMSRGDGAGLGVVWETVIEPTNIIRLIMEGYLCDVKAKAVEVGGLDLGAVARKAGGDFADGSLGDALEAAGVADAIANAYVEHASRDDEGRARPGVVFTPTVAFAHSCSDALNQVGITSEVISGKTSEEDRALIYKRYREGETRVLSNCMVLTEGWDAPWAEVAVIARPTRAQGLYTQMVGRVLRTFPGKEQALVLDVCGSSRDNSLIGVCDLSDAVADVQDGESLSEAVVREQKEAVERERITSTEVRDVQLFDSKEMVKNKSYWQKTSGGIWFARTGRHTYLLWPVKDTDEYRIGRYENLRGQGVEWQATLHGVCGTEWLPRSIPPTRFSFEWALGWADPEVMREDRSIGGKDAPWRKKRASDKMKRYARNLGIRFPDDIKGGDLGAKISYTVVSRELHGRDAA